MPPDPSAQVRIQRVYEGAAPVGQAVLVDRIWPRGIRKETLGAHIWLRDIGPSDALRAWFGHRPESWEEFRRRYRVELDREPRRDLIDELVEMARAGPVTLLYGARDREQNQAVVIREVLEEKLRL